MSGQFGFGAAGTSPPHNARRVLMPALAMVVALAAGCVGTTKTIWVKSGATEQEWRRDSYECSRDSRTFYLGSGLGLLLAEIEAKKKARRIYRDCMRARGWEQ